MQTTALKTAGVIFAIVAVAHAVRAITGATLVLGGTSIPIWLSVVAALVTAALAVWMVRAARGG